MLKAEFEQDIETNKDHYAKQKAERNALIRKRKMVPQAQEKTPDAILYKILLPKHT